MVMLLRTWKLRENVEKPHDVPLNKKIFDTISINIRDEAGDSVAFEQGKVIITLHFRPGKTHISFEMVLSLTHLSSMGYDNKPDKQMGGFIITHKSS